MKKLLGIILGFLLAYSAPVLGQDRVIVVGPDGKPVTVTAGETSVTGTELQSIDGKLPASLSAEGGLVVANVAHVDVDNSTTTPLGAGETWTGEWHETLNHGVMFVSVKADQPSAALGIVIEHSSDGVSVTQDDPYSYAGPGGKIYTISPPNSYARVRFVNGATPQGAMDIQTIWRPGMKASSHSINDPIVNQDDAELVKAVVAAADATTGVFQNVQSINGGSLLVSAEPRGFSLAKGLVPGKTTFRQWGYNPTVGAAWETIRNSSSAMPYLAVADTFTVVSSDAEDDPDKGAGVPGTGCHSVRLTGLDASGDPQVDNFATNGAALSTSNLEFIRVFRVECIDVGTLGVNKGALTLADTGASGAFLVAAALEGMDAAAVYTVPTGMILYITSWTGSEAGAVSTRFGLWFRPPGESWRVLPRESISYANFERTFQVPPSFTAGTDIEVRSYTTGGSGVVSAGFEGWYE